MAAFIITRIQTGDYDKWRPMFDQDQPRAREKAQVQRVLQSVDDPNEVFIYLEFGSLEDANEARERLLSSGVLERFEECLMLEPNGRVASLRSLLWCLH